MRHRSTPFLAAFLLLCLVPAAAQAQLADYFQDFENLVQTSPTALADDGWIVFGNVYDTDGTTFLYGYGPFDAPNHAAAFSQIDILQGGVDQGLQQLSIFNDYENTDHALGRFIESNVFQEQIIGAGNAGETWEFSFQVKRGLIAGQTTAKAFIKTIDPNNGYAMTNFINLDMTNVPDTWDGYTISIDIIPELAGQFLQFGFLSTATLYEPSGVFYDNVLFQQGEATDAPVPSTNKTMLLAQNYPNPFNPSTKIDFRLDTEGQVELSIYDVAGRRVATLERGELGAGDHSVIWNGRTDKGAPVASGLYRYVLKTPQGQLSRSMTLLK